MRGGRGGKGTRGWLPGQTDRLADTGKALGVFGAATTEVLPPPLFPERSLRTFRWNDPDGSATWLVEKETQLSLLFSTSPFNLDASGNQKDGFAGGTVGITNSGPSRLLSYLSYVLNTKAFPLELVTSRKRSAHVAALIRGRVVGKGGLSGDGAAVQQFLRAAKQARVSAIASASGARLPTARKGEGGEEVEAEGEGEDGAESSDGSEESEEDFNDYAEDHYDENDDDEGGGGGGGDDYDG